MPVGHILQVTHKRAALEETCDVYDWLVFSVCCWLISV